MRRRRTNRSRTRRYARSASSNIIPKRRRRYQNGGRTSCPPGQHMMPDGTCMQGAYHGAPGTTGYRRGGLSGGGHGLSRRVSAKGSFTNVVVTQPAPTGGGDGYGNPIGTRGKGMRVRGNSPYALFSPYGGGNNPYWTIICCGNDPVSGQGDGEGSLYHTTMVNCFNQCGSAFIDPA